MTSLQSISGIGPRATGHLYSAQRKITTPILPQSKEMVMFYHENSKIAKPNGPIAMSHESGNSETSFNCGVDAKDDERRVDN